MKNIRLFIEEKNVKKLKLYSDEIYLYDYFVNNYTELDEDNIFRNPTYFNKINGVAYLYIENIDVQDLDVWNETCKELNKNKIPYYAVITNTSNNCFSVYSNMKEKIPKIKIGRDNFVLELIKNIENLDNYVIELEEER